MAKGGCSRRCSLRTRRCAAWSSTDPKSWPLRGPSSRLLASSDRCELAAADFFKSVPEGGDVYVLAQILHDWPDHDALGILRVCAAAMAPAPGCSSSSRCFPAVAPRNVLPALMDVNMLIMLGGKERTGDEYEALLETSGFTGTVVKPTSGMWSVVEATKR